jgi:mono/diheme cytochrome c family protein
MLKQGMSRATTVLAGLLLLAAPVLSQPTGAELTRLVGQGETLFSQKCQACHTLGKGDRPTGPDLAGVTERRDHQWLTSFIADPEKMFAAADPVAVELLAKFNNLPMPSMGLDAAQLEALLAYLAHPVEAVQQVRPQTTPDATGNAARGERLYTGSLAMSNGGAPCIACHALAALGTAGVSNYGPDLTDIYSNYEAEGVAAILESLAFPSMEAIYATRPLTETERLDLTAYFAQAAEQQASPATPLAGMILLGVVIVFAIVALFGLRRLKGVRQPLVDQVRKQRGAKQ